ncbi:polypyrimidine tract-binding protein 2 [Marchantia polymorpha subsp. ruderalis]|uniref:RRM domain-containing protein n=2 Tax=Marchantia polymorpha TaxID=3197 RepID=A0AAF6BXZ0_MARPO|nr:hypothetical protein MARPO_0003s0022 [Marchantia polymorpha]BBN16874.1 hypothetical protein Mp_7g10030 [Marchantia polymorpha subsp. ruderalis]|eukprot:PTQ49113.1 hypothetical protein MARPO_0003s0022 [Marchantia polymorpha]
MTSTAGQPQFRYTQPPSKVLHVRNLPWECSSEELIELCKPFGKVVNTKVNVGANHNQAFVEFADLNQAIAMVSYYASSSEPAQVRGKTVYLQYSNRQEIVNSKNSGDVASNVLLVTIEGVEAGDVSIDVLHLVFSAFGFVHKIATFEKTAGFQVCTTGFQALVQYSDSNTAASAKSALEGRSIPRYLLPDHVGPCHLRISFSAHNDLNVKFQSHRSRDYTNPYLPVAPSAIDGNGQFGVGPDGKRREPESNVLLVSIENMQYAVTIDVLHTVFSAFGTVQKIAIFEKNAGFQALVQYPDVPTAVAAKDALEGHCIYDGGFCKLHLSYSRHTDLNVKVNNDRSRDYTNPGLPANQQAVLGQAPVAGGSVLDVSQLSPTGSGGYGGNQFGSGVHPPQNDGGAGMSQRPWEYDQTQNGPKAPVGPPMGGGPPLLGPGSMPGNMGAPMSGPGPMYRGPPMPSPPGGPAPPGGSGGMMSNHDAPFQGSASSMSMGPPPPSHMGPGMLPPGPNSHMGPPPPGHGMPPHYGHQPMHQGPQGMPNSGGPPVYYM